MKRSFFRERIQRGHRLLLPWRWFAPLFLLAWCACYSHGLAQGVPPAITNQPQSLIVLAGDTAIFNVGVYHSSTPLSYAWRYFGAYILGATNLMLTNYNVQSSKVGPYSVVVANAAGSVPSSNADLTVVTGPLPASQSVTPGATATFTVEVEGTGPAAYQWRFNDQELPGATSRVLALTNVQPWQIGAYSVMVSNPAGFVITSNAVLAVEARGPRLWGAMWGPDGFRFQVTGSANTPYRVQASHDVKDWTDIFTNIAPTSGTFEVIDPDASMFNWRCYRALQP